MEPETETLTKQQNDNILHAVRKMYNTERIVNHNINTKQWKIKNLYRDTLWVKLIDEPDADTIMRGGIAIPVATTKGLFRLGQVMMCGPDIKYANVGEIVRFPQGVGQPYEKSVDGYKTWLLREESVIAVVEFDGTEEEYKEHLETDLHLQL